MATAHGTFRGGIDLSEDKEQTLALALAALPTPVRLRLPLAMADAPPALPLVAPGQRVAAGELLARADHPAQVDMYAPVAGIVTACDDVAVAGRGANWRTCPALELRQHEGLALPEPTGIIFDWAAASAPELADRLAQGALLHFDEGVSLASWLERAKAKKADVLIANIMENAPMLTGEHRLLAQLGPQVVGGLAILASLLQPAQTLLAVDRARTGKYAAAAAAARKAGIASYALAAKYPIGAEAILAYVLTRRQTPLGGRSLDIGVAMVDAHTCWAVYQWVALGRRLGGRVVTVAGGRCARPGNYYVPLGAVVADVAEAAGAGKAGDIIHGSPMTGSELPAAAVVGPGTNGLLAIDKAPWSTPTACIRCCWCTDNCPVQLNVPALNDDFELGRLDLAGRHCATGCVGCGICTYVCPARLPLSHRVGQLRRALLAGAGGDHP